MRDREQPDKVRNALVIACDGIIGAASVVELRLILPHNPIATMMTVLGPAFIATAITLRASRR